VSPEGFGFDWVEAGIFIPAMTAPADGDPPSACDTVGITQANPLPASISWRKRPAEAIAAKPRKRRMIAIFSTMVTHSVPRFQPDVLEPLGCVNRRET
jgi:hypothetical protein